MLFLFNFYNAGIVEWPMGIHPFILIAIRNIPSSVMFVMYISNFFLLEQSILNTHLVQWTSLAIGSEFVRFLNLNNLRERSTCLLLLLFCMLLEFSSVYFQVSLRNKETTFGEIFVRGLWKHPTPNIGEKHFLFDNELYFCA